MGVNFTEMCSGSEAGSYLRLIDFVYHSTLGLRVIMKKKKVGVWGRLVHTRRSEQRLDREGLRSLTRRALDLKAVYWL